MNYFLIAMVSCGFALCFFIMSEGIKHKKAASLARDTSLVFSLISCIFLVLEAMTYIGS